MLSGTLQGCGGLAAAAALVGRTQLTLQGCCTLSTGAVATVSSPSWVVPVIGTGG